jgi:peptidyl-prolyl cis-trans isomerase A (cyclophilin A)
MNFPEINVPGQGQLHARLTTSLGDIVVRLEEQKAPNTVKNFVGLAAGTQPWKDPESRAMQKGRGLYDGVRFHRVIPDFMIQSGDPNSRYAELGAEWGRGNPGYRFADEFHPELRHDGPGVLSMANSGPNTNGSQWFITERATPHLDNKHSVFGRAVSGQDVVNRIANVPATGYRPIVDVVVVSVTLFRE